jgi:hypothetical protein
MRGGVPQHLRSRAGVKRSDAVKSADALVLVYSITDRESFKALSGLRDDVLKYVHRAPRSHARASRNTLLNTINRSEPETTMAGRRSSCWARIRTRSLGVR